MTLLCALLQPGAVRAESPAGAAGGDHLASLLIRHDLRYALQARGNERPDCSQCDSEHAQ